MSMNSPVPTSKLPHGSNLGQIEVRVARGVDEMMVAFAIRSAVYLAEQSCPYNEEFDGNDVTATHVVAYIDNEPAATMRIRYFGNFAKLERLAVRREYRAGAIGGKLIAYAVDFVRRKGFTAAYGHAQEGRERYWEYSMRHIGKGGPLQDVERFEFSGHSYTAMGINFEPIPDAITMQSDPNLLNRPEGEWDRPGVLEKSIGKLPEPVRKIRQ